MNVNLSFLSRTAGLLAGALLTLTGARAAVESDALPTFNENFITLSGGGPLSLSGSHAAFQSRTRLSRNGEGGIEDFNYTADVADHTTFSVDAKLLPGAEDYLAQFKLTKDEVGSVEVGYKRGRTFYDGMGGFFPINNAWLPLYSRTLYVDRGKFFANATVALPKHPVFTFRYMNATRGGRKDSTIWGDTDQTGVPIYSLSSLNPISANRKLVPAYIQLGERQETLELAVQHSVANTSLRFAVLAGRINNLDTRSVDRYPGELKPFPAIPSNPVTLVPPLLANNANKGFDQQGFKEDSLTFSGKIETKINELATAYVSGSFRHATEDITGSRLITAVLQTPVGVQSTVGLFTPAGRPPYSYNSAGTMKMNVYTGVIGVALKPAPTLDVDVALKAEDFATSGATNVTYVNTMVTQATGVATPVVLPAAPNSFKISEKPWTPEVSARYVGIPTVSLYGSWDYKSSPGDERTNYMSVTTSTAGPVVLAAPTVTNDDVKEKHSNLTLGGNWAPYSAITFRAEVFTKDHENRFEGYGPSVGAYYILDYDIYGTRLSATLKATPTLAFGTRFVHQRGKASIAEDGYAEGDSNDSKRYQFSETVDWTPTKIFYVQGNVNIVWDKMSTSYPRAGGSANDVLHNADNNYWNASVVSTFVVDKTTDAQVQATYYKADNYNPALAAATDPYGQGGRDYSVTLGLKHKFSDRVVGLAKVGYFNSTSDTTGGFANYKGTVGYLSLQFKL